MPVTFQSVRFGTVEVPEESVLDFPFGLIGLGGARYAIVENNPGSGFFWLHCVKDEALALPIVRPAMFFADFELKMSEMDHERVGFAVEEAEDLYLVVRAAPDPMETTANLRAPIVVREGKGFQVLNEHEPAPLRAPLFELAEPAAEQPLASADAA